MGDNEAKIFCDVIEFIGKDAFADAEKEEDPTDKAKALISAIGANIELILNGALIYVETGSLPGVEDEILTDDALQMKIIIASGLKAFAEEEKEMRRDSNGLN